MMKKFAMMFPGQGSQYSGMGKYLYKRYSFAKQFFQEADELLGLSLTRLCLESDIKELTRTDYAQPAILLLSVISYNAFKEETELTPQFMAGHSLGEYSALACAGVLNWQDALKLVRKRGELMCETSGGIQGGMIAVKDVSSHIIKEYLYSFGLFKDITISNINAPGQIILSGSKQGLLRLKELLENDSIKVTVIKTDRPFHSPYMSSAAKAFYEELRKYSFKPSKIKVFSNVTAKVYEEDSDYPHILSDHITNPVKWWDVVKEIIDYGVEVFVEMGPGRVLRNIIEKNISGIDVFSSDNPDDIRNFKLNYIEKLSDINERSEFFSACIREAICTKNSLCSDNYENSIIVPLEKLKFAYENPNDSILSSVKVYEYGIDLLKSIFNSKGVPFEEQQNRLMDLKNCYINII